MRALLGITLALSIWSTIAGAAVGQDLAAMDEESEARVAFRAGQSAFQRGHYATAMESFREAYSLEPRSELLYDIGESAHRAERPREALEAFEAYLEEISEVHPRRAGVTRKVAELREVLRERATEEAEGPGAAPWVLTGLGAALTLTGAVLLGVGLSERSAADDPSRPPAEAEDAREAANTLTGASIALLSLGILGFSGGLYWGLASRSEVGGALALQLLPLGAVLRGRF